MILYILFFVSFFSLQSSERHPGILEALKKQFDTTRGKKDLSKSVEAQNMMINSLIGYGLLEKVTCIEETTIGYDVYFVRDSVENLCRYNLDGTFRVNISLTYSTKKSDLESL